MATHIMDSFREIFIGTGYGWEIPYSGLLWFVYESNPLYISREQTYVPFFHQSSAQHIYSIAKTYYFVGSHEESPSKT